MLVCYRVTRGFAAIDDPAHRMAIGIRQYIRRAHEEPQWGRFMTRFGMSLPLLQTIWSSDPVVNMKTGIASGRYKIGLEQLPAMVGLVSGGTLAGMVPVLEGHGTWRDIGSDTAELVLIALGIAKREAKSLARSALPPLTST